VSISRRSRFASRWWELEYRVGPNLWLVPVVMSIGAVLLFNLTGRLDRSLAVDRIPDTLVSSSPGDAFVVLAALLGAVATSLALVFSTTILTFSIASSQLGPRLIRRFMRDPVTQVTLGSFMATLIFLVMTLSSVNSTRSDGVPTVSVAVSILLSLGCFAGLVFYVHHVAATIQAPSVVASVVRDLRRVLAERDVYLPGVPRASDPTSVSAAVAAALESGAPVGAGRSGYVELLDHARMLAVAERADAVVVLERRPGQFVVQGQTIARVVPASALDEVQRIVHDAVQIGDARTLRQDEEFALAQVVEIALRALSPAINDTYTGLTCIDWLGAAMVQIGRHPEPTGGWCSDDGRLRLVEPALHFERELKAAFDLIRQSGAQNPAVLIRLLDVLTEMAPLVHHERLPALAAHVELVHCTALAAQFVQGDQDDITQRHAQATALLEARLGSAAG
jgi:uncharacterized membrane protein